MSDECECECRSSVESVECEIARPNVQRKNGYFDFPAWLLSFHNSSNGITL